MRPTQLQTKGLLTKRASNRRHAAMLLAAAGAAFALPVGRGVSRVQAQSVLYFDSNGASAGLGANGTWNASGATWTTNVAGTSATQAWVPGDIAAFGVGATVTLADSETIGGINFSTGAVTIGAATGNNAAVLNIGSSNININNAVSSNESIYVPINGSGNITYNYTGTGGSISLNLSGAMAGFSGNLYVNPGASQNVLAQVQLDSSLGAANGASPSTSTIYLGNFTEISDDNPVTSGIAAPTAATFTNYNNISTGYLYTGSGLANAWVSASDGATINGVPTQKIETYAGVIYGNSNVTFGIGNSGGRGTVILAAGNTYTGNTYVTLANTNGLLQLGVDNAIPATSTLTFGPNPAFTTTSSSAVAPLDLNGHNLTVAGLATNNANTAANGVGNIYNTNTSSSPTLTITGSANTVYKGDIGDTNVVTAPFNAMAPYYTSGTINVTGSTGIALTLNGPGSLTLAPVAALANGNEYTGQTTVNGGSLILGRVTAGQAGADYTLQSSNIVVGGGATLSTVYAPATSYVGGTGGTITINSGSTFTPGGTVAPNNTAIVSSGNLVLNGANLDFDVNGLGTFDQLVLTGGVTLNSGTNTINIASTSAQLPGGYYPIIQTQGGVSGAGNFVLGTTPGNSNGTTYSIGQDPTNPNNYDLIVKAPTLQWDPTGNGVPVAEAGGTWTNGTSTFVNLQTDSETTWSNLSPDDVIIGNNASGNPGTIGLGSSIVVNGELTFGPVYVFSGQGYDINNGGNPANTLTTTKGINVISSAEIDSAVALAQSQTWSVGLGQTLTVNGTLSQISPSTLTASGPGTILLSGTGGSISGLQISGGSVALLAVDAVGTAPISINGGTLGLGASATYANNITFGTSGGGIGPYGGATPTVTANLNTSGNVTVGGSGTLTLAGTNTFGSLTLASATLAVASNASLGSAPITFSGGGLSVSTVTTLSNNLILAATNTAGQGDQLTFGPSPLTLSGVIGGSGDLHVYGTGTLTLSGSNTFSGGAFYVEQPLTINVTNPAGLSTGTIAIDAPTTLNIETNVNAGPIRGSAVWTKTGTGTLTVSGSSGTAPAEGLGVIIQQGNIQLNSLAGLGGNNNDTSASAAPQAAMTVDSGTELLINTSGQRASGNITLAGGSIIRLPIVSTGDFAFTILGNDVGSSTTFVYNYANNISPALTVTASSLIDNQQQAIVGTSNDLMITEPVVVNTGAKLTLEADNTAGNYEQAGVILRGTTNNTVDPYQAITLQPGATIQDVGTGDVDLGGTGRGEPIIGQGTPGSDAVLQLGSHTLLRDQGAATQDQGTTDTTRLIVDGTGSAGLRIEAPMNATYTVPLATGAPAMRTYDGTTGLFGINNTATASSSTTPGGYTTLGNDFTVFSPNRAEGLSNTYTLPSGQTITPGGTLTLAATDPGGATGVVNAGPAQPSAVSLALDNTAGSGNLVYQIDPAANGATFGNFAGLTVERSYPAAGTVTAQLLGNTTIPTLTVAGAVVDISSHDLIVTQGNLATITALVQGGYNQGAWNGNTGILSSTAASDSNHLTAVGVLLNDDGNGNPLYGSGAPLGLFDGTNPPVDAVLVKYTYYGDTNLDGVVDGSDYARVDNGYLNHLTGWSNGDFNYDGVVNGSDYTLMDNAFNQQGASLAGQIATPTSEFATLQASSVTASSNVTAGSNVTGASAVPEPAAISLFGLGAIALLGRRRRHAR
jgi:hypothetical protein